MISQLIKILQRDYEEKCHSSGRGGKDSSGPGTHVGESSTERREDPGYVEDAELEELIAAGESAVTER